MALVFGALLVPMVGEHSLLGNALGGDGGLGSIRPAPGAGYLLASRRPV
jgi:hypothetical protein